MRFSPPPPPEIDEQTQELQSKMLFLLADRNWRVRAPLPLPLSVDRGGCDAPGGLFTPSASQASRSYCAASFLTHTAPRPNCRSFQKSWRSSSLTWGTTWGPTKAS